MVKGDCWVRLYLRPLYLLNSLAPQRNIFKCTIKYLRDTKQYKKEYNEYLPDLRNRSYQGNRQLSVCPSPTVFSIPEDPTILDFVFFICIHFFILLLYTYEWIHENYVAFLPAFNLASVLSYCIYSSTSGFCSLNILWALSMLMHVTLVHFQPCLVMII